MGNENMSFSEESTSNGLDIGPLSSTFPTAIGFNSEVHVADPNLRNSKPYSGNSESDLQCKELTKFLLHTILGGEINAYIIIIM